VEGGRGEAFDGESASECAPRGPAARASPKSSERPPAHLQLELARLQRLQLRLLGLQRSAESLHA